MKNLKSWKINSNLFQSIGLGKNICKYFGHRFTFDTKIRRKIRQIKTNLESYGPDQRNKKPEYPFYLSKYVELSQFLRWWHTTHARTSLSGMGHFLISLIYFLIWTSSGMSKMDARAHQKRVHQKMRRSKWSEWHKFTRTNENAIRKKIARSPSNEQKEKKKKKLMFRHSFCQINSKLNATRFASSFLRSLYATIYLLILYACFSSLFFSRPASRLTTNITNASEPIVI